MLDPKLEKYRAKKMPAPKYTPKTLEEFIGVLQRTPRSIITNRDRERIVAIMSFDEKRVGDLMADKSRIVFVKRDEILGPLVLDKLYKSGFKSFPVVDGRDKVIGVIHTEALNALEIKKTERAEKYMDEKVNYLKESDSLEYAVEEIEQTDSYYFLVTDAEEKLVGCFTVQMLLEYLVGKR
jgi:CBS domain containing-hemolysin-like protein